MTHQLRNVTGAAIIGVMAVFKLAIGRVGAESEEDDGEEDSGTTIIDFDPVVDAIDRLIDSLRGEFQEALLYALYEPFNRLAQALSDVFVRMIWSYPDVTRTEVLELHRLVFQVSAWIAVVVLVVIGLLHIVGRRHGLKPAVMVLLALGAGGVAPWLLEYAVELSRILTLVFRPDDVGFWQITRLSLLLIVVAIIKAVLLVGIVVLFVVRDVFLMLFVVLAPLVFLGALMPYTRRISDLLTRTFVAFLVIGPLEMIVYRLVLLLLATPDGEIPSWIYAIGGLTILFGLPLLILGAGLTVAAPAFSTLQQVNVLGPVQGERERQQSEQEEDNRLAEQNHSAENRFRERGNDRFGPGHHRGGHP